MAELLVVGYGNDLRRDDRAGREVAARLAERELPHVEIVSVTQLTPELASVVGGRDTVVFVDASVATDKVAVESVCASRGGSAVVAHHADPPGLLALAEQLGHRPRRSLWVTIPATDLGFGFELSAGTEAGVDEAVEMIAALRQPGSR